MELVYLWVEKYKNIEKQGFNFSPRFECKFYDEYDEEGKLKDDCKLEITENKEYVSIFPENINITVIVGENGSGKTAILEYMCYQDLEDPKSSKKNIFIYKQNNNINIYTSSQYKVINHTEKNYFFSGRFDDVRKIIKKRDQIPRGNLTQYNDLNNTINISNEVKLEEVFEKLKQEKKHLYFFDLIAIHESRLLVNFFSIKDCKFPNDFILPQELIIFRFINDNTTLSISRIQEIIKKLLIEYNINEYTINKLFNILETLEVEITFDGFVIKEKSEKKIFKLVQILQEIYRQNPELQNILLLHMNNKVSSGTIELIKLLSTLHEAITEFQKKTTSVNEFLIILDEVENSFHPNWQKKIIKLLMDFFKLNFNNLEIHFIFSTHSSFLLSDIPQDNIIFLKKDTAGNCKNITQKIGIQTFGANIHTLLSHGFFMKDGLMGEFAKGKIENIRKFYNKVILHKDDAKYKTKYKCLYEEKQKEFWHIQKIIGEPFLQTIVKNQLEEIELILLGKKEAIDNEIARLQALKESFKDD